VKSTIIFIFVLIISAPYCFGQYNKEGSIITVGTNYSKYLGKGEGDNYFKVTAPGIQLAYALNSGTGFEWVVWGMSYYKAHNIVGTSDVPVRFISFYYTDFIFYQAEKKHPLFIYFGCDVTGMKFPNMEKSDFHFNITAGGGWNVRLKDNLFLQLKLKPYIVFGNSIGQNFGINSIVNLHICL
jgi:hypothetical protein